MEFVPNEQEPHQGRARACGVVVAVSGGAAVLLLPRAVPPPQGSVRRHAARAVRLLRPQVGGGDRTVYRRGAGGKCACACTFCFLVFRFLVGWHAQADRRQGVSFQRAGKTKQARLACAHARAFACVFLRE